MKLEFVNNIFVLLLSLALVLCSSVSCHLDDGWNRETLAYIAVDKVDQALSDVNSYRYNTQTTQFVTSRVAGDVMEVTTSVSISTGAFDIENKSMTNDTSIVQQADTGVTVEARTLLYLVDNIIYMKGEIPGQESRWFQLEAPQWYWGQVNALESHLRLLRVADAEVLDSEYIQGVDCYRVHLAVDAESIGQLAMQSQGISAEELAKHKDLLLEIHQDYSVEYWIAKETHLIIKTKTKLSYKTPTLITGILNTNSTTEVTIVSEYSFFDYNQPISIILPKLAEGAYEQAVK